ncbi:glycosyltransferase family 32 protein [Halalkalibaculum sp. DA3122]|uniref:glycosyltransferase family 32 protein n=1 Tax=Halalkalibaculum sp. DA3122 TaxID=3373607 RepID=UPI003754F281
MKIPKIIHYCWFGPKDIPDLERKCIESWKQYLPDYKLKFWNEQTFDIESFQFAKQAYENEYYAFVSDFVRAMVLYKHGGIYLDTDLEVLQNFTPLLKGKEAVLGFENSSDVGTALMAFKPKHPIVKNFADHYKNRSFIDSDGNIQLTANPQVLGNVLVEFGVELNGKEQKIDSLHVYNREKFFPKKIEKGEFKTTKETVTIHHYKGSWLTKRQKQRGENKFWVEVCRPILRKCKDWSSKIIGNKQTKKLEIKVRNWLR